MYSRRPSYEFELGSNEWIHYQRFASFRADTLIVTRVGTDRKRFICPEQNRVPPESNVTLLIGPPTEPRPLTRQIDAQYGFDIYYLQTSSARCVQATASDEFL